MESENNSSMEEMPTYEPIVCPCCKSKNLAFITEYHKAIGAKVLEAIFLFITIVILISSGFDFEEVGPIFVCFIFATLITHLYIAMTESKTHVQCICKDCGHTWLHT